VDPGNAADPAAADGADADADTEDDDAATGSDPDDATGGSSEDTEAGDDDIADDAAVGAEDDDAVAGTHADADAQDDDAAADVEDDDAVADEDAEDATDAAVDPDASGDAAPTGGPQGQVGDWIREAMAVLQAEGVPVDKMDPDDIATIIEHESGGDPEATNDWDSNAAKGTPSQGLMQTIGPTFDSYKLEGHDEIKDPVDNIIAGVRYAIDRYGSVSQVPGVEAVARGDAYVGY
jgi:soluble lytic murein transglycosylase-like protein